MVKSLGVLVFSSTARVLFAVAYSLCLDSKNQVHSAWVGKVEDPPQKRPRGQRGGKKTKAQKEFWKRTEEGLHIPSSGYRSEKPIFGSQRHSVVETAQSDRDASASSSVHTAPQDLASQVSQPAAWGLAGQACG